MKSCINVVIRSCLYPATSQKFFFIIMFQKERKFPLWAASNGRGSSQRKKRAREGKKENWAGGESEENWANGSLATAMRDTKEGDQRDGSSSLVHFFETWFSENCHVQPSASITSCKINRPAESLSFHQRWRQNAIFLPSQSLLRSNLTSKEANFSFSLYLK